MVRDMVYSICEDRSRCIPDEREERIEMLEGGKCDLKRGSRRE